MMSRPLTRRRFLGTTLLSMGAFALSSRLAVLVKGQNAATWQPLLAQNAGPSPRMNHGMIYDPVADRLVVFGGSAQGGFLNDVWTYSFADMLWSKLTPTGLAPQPRRTPTTVYDPEHHRMVVYAGQGKAFFNDAWSFDLSSQRWSELDSAPSPPTPRDGALRAFDPTSTWQGLNRGRHPSARTFTSLVHDPEHSQLLVFGGRAAQTYGDLWSLDLQTQRWSQITAAEESPQARHGHNAAWVGGRGMVVFGGMGQRVLNDLWLLTIA